MSNIRLNAAIDSIEEEKVRERRMKQRRRGVGNLFAERGDTRDQASVQASLLAQVALLQDREKRMGERDEQHWQPSSLYWESNHALHSNGYLRSIIEFINSNFWRQSQYRAKVHPFEGSGKSENSIIDFTWLIKLLGKVQEVSYDCFLKVLNLVVNSFLCSRSFLLESHRLMFSYQKGQQSAKRFLLQKRILKTS